MSQLSISQADYARHRGVSRQAVHKLVKAGAIPVDGKGRIVSAADADFVLDSNRERVNERDLVREEAPALAPRAAESSGLTRARTATEAYKARFMQLQYEKAAGNLVETAKVASAAMTCNETLVHAIEQVANRSDEVLAAAKDGAAGVRAVLKRIARDLRRVSGEAFAKLAVEPLGGDAEIVEPMLPEEVEA